MENPLKDIIKSTMLTINPELSAENIVYKMNYYTPWRDYYVVRIPVICITNKGTLLAFAEGRDGGDTGNIDLILRRSEDNGQTWSDAQLVWDAGNDVAGNPCPIVNKLTGRIFLLMTWNKNKDTEYDIMTGNSENVRIPYICHSDDDGLTWSKPKDISETTRGKTWCWYATGPVNGIQINRGKYKGRLVAPCNHSSNATSTPNKRTYRAHIVYSDDNGETWKKSNDQLNMTNESTIAELEDGSIMQNMRSYHNKNCRAVSYTKNGGLTWNGFRFDEILSVPRCQGSLIRYNFAKYDYNNEQSLDPKFRRGRIMFCCPSGSNRTHLKIWISYNDGFNWEKSKIVYNGCAAYSNLVILQNGKIGVLYEKDRYRKIVFETFTLDELEKN